MKIKISIIILFCFRYLIGFAQNEITERMDFERIIENLLPQQEVDVDYNDLYDRLITLYANPIDLNSADREELQSLFILTEQQLTGIVEYRKKFGGFLTVFELLTIDGFDKETVERIRPFVQITTGEKATFSSGLKQPDQHEIFLRTQTTLQQKKGYTAPDTTSAGKLTSRYAGDPFRLYGRYAYVKDGQYSLGFTFEKDPGEQIIWDKPTSRYGLDYYSFHLMLENKWIFKKIIIGDYTMDFGQSLVFGSGIRMGKGYEPITTIRRNSLGLRPYRSVYENRDFSGAAISTGTDQFEFNLFYSQLKRDAILRDETELDADQYVSYIQTIGLHRTISEIDAKHSISEQSFGGNMNFKTPNQKLEIGLNGILSNFNLPLYPANKKYNQFEFKGLSNALGSAYFSYYLRNANIFTEFALSESGGKAIVVGAVASLSSQLQASVHLRSYDRHFHSFYAEGFGENTKIANEQGVYWGLRLQAMKGLTLATYFDFFAFPWLKYQVDMPSKGQDFMISSIYEVNKNFNFRIQYRYKKKEMNHFVEGEQYVEIVPKSTSRILMDMNYLIDKNYSIKTRIQYSNVDFGQSKTNGFILAQDINYNTEKIGFSARFALYDTDDYDNRQFIYERDLLYVYSVPFFYNKGARYYLVAKYHLNRNISFWLKYATSIYQDVESLGKGLEQIDGNKNNSFSFQTRIRL